MDRLITSEEVVAMTFSDDELYNRTMIIDSDIIEAESRYIIPILGKELTSALLSGNYATLLTEYVKPALAACVRYVAEPYMAERCVACSADSLTTADNQRLSLRLLALRRRVKTLTRRLSDHLNAHADDYAEYSVEDNPKNRCMIYGDVVQVY